MINTFKFYNDTKTASDRARAEAARVAAEVIEDNLQDAVDDAEQAVIDAQQAIVDANTAADLITNPTTGALKQFDDKVLAVDQEVDDAIALITDPTTGALKQVDDKIAEADVAIEGANSAAANANAVTYQENLVPTDSRFDAESDIATANSVGDFAFTVGTAAIAKVDGGIQLSITPNVANFANLNNTTLLSIVPVGRDIVARFKAKRVSGSGLFHFSVTGSTASDIAEYNVQMLALKSEYQDFEVVLPKKDAVSGSLDNRIAFIFSECSSLVVNIKDFVIMNRLSDVERKVDSITDNLKNDLIVSGLDNQLRYPTIASVGSGTVGTFNTANVPFRYSNPAVNDSLSGKYISKIGCYWRCRTEGQWNAGGNVFTFYVINKNQVNLFPNSDLVAAARKAIQVQVVIGAWNSIEYHEVAINELLSPDETLVFGGSSDTISPIFYANQPSGISSSVIAASTQSFYYGSSGSAQTETFRLDFDIKYDLFKSGWSTGYFAALVQELRGKRVAVIGDSISTYTDQNAVERTIIASDVGVPISAFALNPDVGKIIGGYTIQNSDRGNQITVTPVLADVGKTIGAALNSNTSSRIGVFNNLWAKRLADTFGWDLQLNAHSGSAYTRARSTTDAAYLGVHAWSQSTINKCRKQNSNGSYSDPEVIVIYRGTNDFSYPDSNGRYPIITDTALDESFVMPTNDLVTVSGTQYYGFREAIILTINSLRTAYPFARIFVCTLNHFKRVNFTTFPVHNGLHSLPEYNNAIRQVCDFMGVDVIELDKSGITFQNNIAGNALFPSADPVHPNGAGHKYLFEKARKDLLGKF
jgi:lysophospholipase L1-like esterase